MNPSEVKVTPTAARAAVDKTIALMSPAQIKDLARALLAELVEKLIALAEVSDEDPDHTEEAEAVPTDDEAELGKLGAYRAATDLPN